MRKINKIIIHVSDSPDKLRGIGAADIKRWHTDEPPKGNGWSDIGYHYVIKRNGIVEDGRPIDRAGAHTKGHNADSIGICWVGRNKFTDEQKKSMIELVNELMDEYELTPNEVKGHKEFFSGKTCPNLDMDEVRGWMNGDLLPDEPTDAEIEEKLKNAEKDII